MKDVDEEDEGGEGDEEGLSEEGGNREEVWLAILVEG